ncbi:MAG: cytochrome c oxidase subunit 2 [Planctomycetota bacterium]|jgi:cytochrome c oxidase subunit 2
MSGSGGWSNVTIPKAFTSNGERIYFTGISESGNPITAVGGDFHMSMHRSMHSGGCATCHGEDKMGRRMRPQFWKKAPALTPSALFEDSSEDSKDHGHNHQIYTPESIRLAITDGLNPAGVLLDAAMPQWSMSDADLDDLVTYLQLE